MQINPNRERCLRRFNNEIQNTLINCKAKPQYTRKGCISLATTRYTNKHKTKNIIRITTVN